VGAALKTRSSLANGGGRVLSLIVTPHAGATMGRQLIVQPPHLFRFLRLLATGVLIARCGLLHLLSPKVLQDARTQTLPRIARRTKKRRGLLAENSSQVKMRELDVNLARSDAVICHLLQAHPIRLQIMTGGAGHERASRHVVVHLRHRPPRPTLSSPAGNLSSCHAQGIPPQPPLLSPLPKWLKAIQPLGLAPSVPLDQWM